MFVDFQSILDTTRIGFPFGVAQIGKAFRNEITPGNFIFRTREFEQMEIEYFIHEKDWKRYFDMWLDELKAWVTELGLKDDEVVYHDIPKEDLAHYSKRTVDVEYKYPFGQSELYGLAYRTDFDLKRHADVSGKELTYRDPVTNEKFIPHVIEPSLGVDRSVLAVLCSAYTEEQAPTTEEGETDMRVVMKFPKALAPYQVAVLPLSKKEQLSSVARTVAKDLKKHLTVTYDETQSIGRRYRRQDEIGTPYCVTLDFESLEDKKATVRDRDTMQQDRVALDQLQSYLIEKFNA
jgi:glycyl-tRNA synthetase